MNDSLIELANSNQELGIFPSFGHPLCKTCPYDKNSYYCAMSKNYKFRERWIKPVGFRKDACRYLRFLAEWMLEEKPARVVDILSLLP